MKKVNYKKLILPNIPYVFIALIATKLGQAFRLAPGTDFSSKLLGIMDGFSMAFQNIMPSFHPIDLLVGVAAAAIIRLVVYFKGKNAKKYRKNIEYICYAQSKVQGRSRESRTAYRRFRAGTA